MDLERLVIEKLNGHSKCSGHCQELSKLSLLRQNGMLIGCYACSSGYVSLLVQYGKELDLPAFKKYLLSTLQENVTDEDIRVATRYSWDLDIKSEVEGAVLSEAYWRQSYRRTKNDDPARTALFKCAKCSSFYHKRISDKNQLCPQCESP